MPQPERMAMNQPRADWGGPYLHTACFCHEVKQVPGGWNIGLIVDSLQMAGDAAFFDGFLFVALYPGPVREPLVLAGFLHDPDGEVKPVIPGDDQLLTPPTVGESLMPWTIPMQILFAGVGVYWFELVVNGRFLTRIPVKVLPGPVTVTMGPEEELDPKTGKPIG